MSRKQNDSITEITPPADLAQAIGAVGAAVQAFQRSTDAWDDAAAAHLGLNRRDLRCLDWLATEGPMTPSALAEAVALSSAATTTMLDRLEQRGLVVRERDTADRRRVFVALTDEARAAIGALWGPLAAAGLTELSRYDAATLATFEALLRESAAIIDARRDRLARGDG